MDINEKILGLIQDAFDDLENPEVSLSSVIRKAIRIANLRNDSKNLEWLKLNMITLSSARKEDILAFNYSKRVLEDYVEYRQVPTLTNDLNMEYNGDICIKSIPEVEHALMGIRKQIEGANISPKSYSIKVKALVYFDIFEMIFKKLETRIHEFFSTTEKQILYDQLNNDIFDKNRRYVDSRLNSIVPEVLDKFISAYKRLSEGDPEARSQALLSCRRILKSVANNVYPPSKEPVICSDGKERKLTDDKYINRLLQFVNENSEGSAEKDILLAQITDLGNRLKSIDSLASKGVHDDVSEYEVNQCVIQTYLLIGDILHLTE
jgi:hypothetical protein